MVKSATGRALVIKRKELELEKAKLKYRMDLTSLVKLKRIQLVNNKLYWIGQEQQKLRQEMSKKGLKSHDGINWYHASNIYKTSNIKRDKISYSVQKFRMDNRLCLQCSRRLPKGKGKYCCEEHRNAFYKQNPNYLKERERHPW